ncbi:MAG: hypothetical protein OEY86_02175 [Nitrospira sp.]|nr:hypothetical protein [Nitrospira sp.]
MSAEKLDSSLVVRFGEQLKLALGQKGGIREQCKYILSFEGFSGNPDSGFLNTSIVSEMLRDTTRNFHVKVIVYLRRQDDFVESMYTQGIHQGESFSFEEYLGGFNHPNALNYTRILDSYAMHFGKENMIVRGYEMACRGDGLVKDFCNAVGIDALPYEKLSHNRNPSYSRVALEIARATNPKLDGEQKKKLRSILQSSSAKDRGEPFKFFSSSERKDFLARFSESNEQISRQYLNSDSGRLFPKPADVDTEYQFKGILPEEVAPILVHILSQELPVVHPHGNPDMSRASGLILRRLLSKFPRVESIVKRAINVVRS